MEDLSGDVSGFLQGPNCRKNAAEIKRQQLNVGDRKTKPWLVWPRVFQGQEAGGKVGAVYMIYVLCWKILCSILSAFHKGELSLVGLLEWGWKWWWWILSQKSPWTHFLITDLVLGAARRQQNVFIYLFLLLFFSCLQYWANTEAIPAELDWNPWVMTLEALGWALNE